MLTVFCILCRSWCILSYFLVSENLFKSNQIECEKPIRKSPNGDGLIVVFILELGLGTGALLSIIRKYLEGKQQCYIRKGWDYQPSPVNLVNGRTHTDVNTFIARVIYLF